jgi:hypothetical protein
MDKKFHQFALQSVLFKGRHDWYFCYLKAEKIAEVLLRLEALATAGKTEEMAELAHQARMLPEAIVRFAASEVSQEALLADLFSLLSRVRFAVVGRLMSAQNGRLLIEEYEQLAEKLGSAGEPSPFVSSEDFSIPALPPQSLVPLSRTSANIKDTSKTFYKGHVKGQIDPSVRQERLKKILEVIRTKQGASIKDISAVVTEYGEKTIQRELMTLIEQGLIRKEGERRWSIYRPVSGIDPRGVQ